MPAWITSELRELVWVPIASSASRITTSRPARASARATASPTIPAPTTTLSALSTEDPRDRQRADPRGCGQGGDRARAAVEREPEGGADQRADGELRGAHKGGRGPRGARKGA